MKRLVFDCSGDIASVAVFHQEELLAELSVTGKKNHASILLPTIDDCLKEADLCFADIDEVYVCSGPGSFTGVKVGLATALGLVAPTRKKLFVFPYAALILSKALMIYPRLLDGVSSDFTEHSENGVVALGMDAGRGEMYCTLVEPNEDGVSVIGSKLMKKDEISAPFVFEHLPARLLMEMPERYRSLFVSEELEPLYFRKSQAEESLDMRRD
ncbi:MAG: tRNA (adenosine(37)-N6)-threonylcarbamoyltransferase complex dimerization subunit type 1 TsaB [Bacillota bacterium]|nr:tRNA (adenosine(37)-N6)-threonylcarbamoyltransferase complex dimerization subunit type 1 TsaB [Bacillota bacterium]